MTDERRLLLSRILPSLILRRRCLPAAKAELGHVDPQINRQYQRPRRRELPPPDTEHVPVIIRPHGAEDRSEQREVYKVPEAPVVFIEFLRIIDAAVEPGRGVGREADGVLQQYGDRDQDAEGPVDGVEVRAVAAEFVGFDYRYAGDEEEERGQVEGCVGAGAGALLGAGVCWLEDEDCLGEEEEGEGLEEGVEGEEDDVVGEDVEPDYEDGDEDAGLGEEGVVWGVLVWYSRVKGRGEEDVPRKRFL